MSTTPEATTAPKREPFKRRFLGVYIDSDGLGGPRTLVVRMAGPRDSIEDYAMTDHQALDAVMAIIACMRNHR